MSEQSVEVEVVECVRISVVERPQNELVSKFLNWLVGTDIYPLQGGMVGGGHMVKYFTPDDAKKVLDWLEKQSCKLEGDSWE